jgi:acyl carrier protein
VGLDSPALSEFMLVIEEKFHIDFSGEQAPVSSVSKLVDAIDGLRHGSLIRAAKHR